MEQNAAADGIVSSIFNFGDSHAVLVNHGNYFMTYSNLSSTTIKRGEAIKAGELLGVVAANISGESEFLFMVSGRSGKPYDPEKFLVKK